VRVGDITVRFNGPATVAEQVVRANMQLQEGSTLEDSLIDRDIRSLYRTGQFEFIEFKRGALVDGKVDLVVEITSKFRVSTITFEGNKKVKAKRLLKEAKTKENLPLDERQVKEDAEKIREFYQKSGYNQAKIEYRIERDKATGLGRVFFTIQEGAKVRIKRVNFDGNTAFSDRKLRKVVETRKWNIFSWLTDTGRFRDDRYETDFDKLRDHYRDHGYLDVEIDAAKVKFDYPKPNRLVLTFSIDEGRQYKLGAIAISGNTLYPTEKLLTVLKLKTGDVFSPSGIEKDQKALENYIGKDGYVDARVRIIRKPPERRHRRRIPVHRGREIQRRVHPPRRKHQDQEHRHPPRTGPRTGRGLQHRPHADFEAAPRKHPLLRRGEYEPRGHQPPRPPQPQDRRQGRPHRQPHLRRRLQLPRTRHRLRRG
jgi:outer membrane protein insertion porin family